MFQAAFCLLLFNIMHLLRIHLSISHDLEPDATSMKNVFDDVRDEHTAMRVLIPSSHRLPPFTDALTAESTRHNLATLLNSVWQNHWLKAPKNHRHPPPPRRRIPGGHTSVFRQIQQHSKNTN